MPEATASMDAKDKVAELQLKRQEVVRNFNNAGGKGQQGGFGGGGRGGNSAIGGVVLDGKSSAMNAPAQAQSLGELNPNGYFDAPQFSGNVFMGNSVAMAQRENNDSANRVADEIQMFELHTKDKLAAKSLSRNEETVIVSYNLDSRTTLISRADQQLIGIATMEMKSNFYKLAVPVLTPYVYNQSSVSNDSNTVLLAGPSASYLDGQFVGRGEVPTTAVGAELTAGFGIDSSLCATRKLVDRTEQTQGGNVVITFEYRLSLENFGDKVSVVRLLSRMPKPDGNQLKPTLVSTISRPRAPMPILNGRKRSKAFCGGMSMSQRGAVGTKVREC